MGVDPAVAAIAAVVLAVVALAGGFSMIGALVGAGIALAPAHLLGGGILIGIAVGLTGHLLGHLAATVASVVRSRSRHRTLLDLLTSPDPSRPQTLILDAPTPVAYCLPAGFSSITVLSRGLLDRLAPPELAAVIAHERAHLTQRHDIVLVAFRAWHSALPWFPIAARAADEVAVLVELLADDGARRTTPDDVLARAIATVSSAQATNFVDPGSAPPRATRDRLARLTPAGVE